jgi:hypothetical protein
MSAGYVGRPLAWAGPNVWRVWARAERPFTLRIDAPALERLHAVYLLGGGARMPEPCLFASVRQSDPTDDPMFGRKVVVRGLIRVLQEKPKYEPSEP